MKKDRADKILVYLGFAKTRSKAAQMIARGEVFYYKNKVLKPSQIVHAEGLESTCELEFVGRGAFKLLKAIKTFSLNFTGKIIADIGASTGGFTQVALLNGAKKVYAIDVGHGQLDPRLMSDKRVINMEGVNIKESESLDDLIDFVVVDLSFISLSKVFSDIIKHLKDGGEGVFLVKPQFELDKKSLSKKGVVKDKEKKIMVLEKIFDLMNPQNICESPIKGKEGNIEYLFYYIKGKTKTDLLKSDLRKLVMERE